MAKRPPPKPLSALSPAYRRRLERAGITDDGGSRQRARGHKEREHVGRRERELREAAAMGLLTPSQRRALKDWARQQAARDPLGSDADDVYSDMEEWVMFRGWDAFVTLRKFQREKQRRYLRFIATGHDWENQTEAALYDELFAKVGFDVPVLWAFYK